MQYHYNKPPTVLSDYIQTVLVVNGDVNSKPSDLPLVTNGMPALLYRTNNKDLHELTIYGQSIPGDNLDFGDDMSMMVFLFRPFSLAPMFKISAMKLKEGPIHLQNWNAQKWMALHLQLIHAKDSEERLEALNFFVVNEFGLNKRDCEIVRFATDQILQNPEQDVLNKIVSTLHLTDRTFQRIFKQYTGISANQYRRICQFYAAFSQLKDNQFDKQTDVAFDNNYFDQSHYIRSFKEFTSITPNDYLQFGLGNKAKRTRPADDHSK